ncbi:MAG: hypothetical protein ACOCYV_03020 [Planctomycetota bacterium]
MNAPPVVFEYILFQEYPAEARGSYGESWFYFHADNAGWTVVQMPRKDVDPITTLEIENAEIDQRATEFTSHELDNHTACIITRRRWDPPPRRLDLGEDRIIALVRDVLAASPGGWSGPRPAVDGG